MDLFLPISSLIGIWFLVVTIPGPNFVAVTQYSISESRVEGFFIAFGVSTGAGIWATASLLGLGVLFVHWPLLYDIIRLVGGLYLMFIGLKIIRAAFYFSLSSFTANQLPVSKYAAFRRGLLTSYHRSKRFLDCITGSILLFIGARLAFSKS